MYARSPPVPAGQRTVAPPASPGSSSTQRTVGDGGIHLLEGILHHGSLAQTVRDIGWSYRHAWGYLRRAERALQTPIVRNRAGRGAARGMELTETGHLLLERLPALRDRIDDALGPTGPTLADVAARGRTGRRPIPSTRGKGKIPAYSSRVTGQSCLVPRS